MEIAIKGVLGAIVAISLHFAVTSRHFYLAGLIPLFPTFALLAHTMFASGDRAGDMQISAQFGMLSLIPYGVYLFLVWWLAVRMNLWLTLTVATLGWGVVAFIIILLWNSNDDWKTSLFYNPLWIALAVVSYIYACLVPRNPIHTKTTWSPNAQPDSVEMSTSIWRNSIARLVVIGSLGCIVLFLGAVYLSPYQGMKSAVHSEAVSLGSATKMNTVSDKEHFDPASPKINITVEKKVIVGTSDTLRDTEPKKLVNELLERAEADIVAQRLTMPPGDNAWERYEAVLSLDPNNTAARKGLMRIMSRYIALAKSADAVGKTSLAAIYLNRARSVLFGTRVQTETIVN